MAQATDLKLVLFDCDGTIIDSQDIIIQAMSMAFEDTGLPIPTAQAVRDIIGLSLEQAVLQIANLPEQQGQEVLPDLMKGYKNSYVALRDQAEHNEKMFEGARDVIELLSRQENVLLGVATGKTRVGLDVVLERENLSHHFHVLKTADDAPSKPHPAMIDQAVSELGVLPHNTVMIGDTSFDMEMAHNAGVMGIGVEWGYHDNHQLGHAHHIATDYPHLLQIMEREFLGNS